MNLDYRKSRLHRRFRGNLKDIKEPRKQTVYRRIRHIAYDKAIVGNDYIPRWEYGDKLTAHAASLEHIIW